MKTAGMIGITAWLYYRRVWAVIFDTAGNLAVQGILEEESKRRNRNFKTVPGDDTDTVVGA